MALTYEDIRQPFLDAIANDRTAQALLEQINSGTGTYSTASAYAARVGDCLAQVLRRYAPGVDISEWDIENLIPGSLGLDHAIVVEACETVQEALNADASIGMRFIEPTFDKDRVYGIVAELRDNPEFTNIEATFYDQIANFSQNVVDEAIRANASTMNRAGISSRVIRVAESKACRWCRDIAGSYDYRDVRDKGNDVWRRHENCRCTIDYVTERNSSNYRERVYSGGEASGTEAENSERYLNQEVVKNASDFDTIWLPPDEYAHVMSELMTNLTTTEKSQSVVMKCIGDYIYTVEVLEGGDSFRVIGKEPLL